MSNMLHPNRSTVGVLLTLQFCCSYILTIPWCHCCTCNCWHTTTVYL